MVLDEQGMQRARGLARELVRVEIEKRVTQFYEYFESVKNTVIEIWETIKGFFEDVSKTLHVLDKQENERSKWHLPLKIEAPTMPDIKIPHISNIRSNI